MFASALQKAINNGINAGDISDQLSNLDDRKVSTKKDALSICQGLRSIPAQNSAGDPYADVFALAALFQNLESQQSPAFPVLADQGIVELVRVYDEIMRLKDNDRNSDLLFLLKIFALYGTKEGAQRIVDAAKSSINSDSYLWHHVFKMFSHNHKQRTFLLRQLSDPIPEAFIGISMLDCANEAAVDGQLKQHPFDSQVGVKRLRELLENPDPYKTSYATSATTALPFMRSPAGQQLLAIGMKHNNGTIRLDSALASARQGHKSGLSLLVKMCSEVNHSDVARAHLHELNCDHLIPTEVNDPSFLAKADFSRWLAHANELGKAPDELDILDHRQLAWPNKMQQVPVWLMKYCLRDPNELKKDNVDIGMVGTTTWCHFSYDMIQRPPEDCYAIHCYWEMECNELISETSIDDQVELAKTLSGWPGQKIESADVELVLKVSRTLKTFQQPVVVARATKDTEKGWAVFEGSTTHWYPETEQPDDSSEYEIAMIHIGSRLLGFEQQPDRKHWLTKAVTVERTAENFILNYERLLAEVERAPVYRQDELIGKYGVLKNNFDQYVEALTEDNGMTSSANLVVAYERLLKRTLKVDRSIRAKSIDSFGYGLYGQKFEEYLEEKVLQNKRKDAVHVINRLEPYWREEHEFALAAFKSGALESAERSALQIRKEKDYYRLEAMSLLAEIWNGRGEKERASELLVDCLQRLVIAVNETDDEWEREEIGREFQQHRATYLRLFSGGAADLAKQGLPASIT